MSQPDQHPTTTGQTRPGPDATVTADAQLPALDDRAVAVLREVGNQWAGQMPNRTAWERALPVDRRMRYLDGEGTRLGRFVHIRSTRPEEEESDLEATPAGDEPDSRLGRAEYAARRVLIGPPPAQHGVGRGTHERRARLSRALSRRALPSVSPATVPIGVAVIVLLVLGNLRGVRAAGVLFAAPTYISSWRSR